MTVDKQISREVFQQLKMSPDTLMVFGIVRVSKKELQKVIEDAVRKVILPPS